MYNLTGYPLREALEIIEVNESKIIEIKKLRGTNNKFNNLNKPYVIRQQVRDGYITLFVAYY